MPVGKTKVNIAKNNFRINNRFIVFPLVEMNYANQFAQGLVLTPKSIWLQLNLNQMI